MVRTNIKQVLCCLGHLIMRAMAHKRLRPPALRLEGIQEGIQHVKHVSPRYRRCAAQFVTWIQRIVNQMLFPIPELLLLFVLKSTLLYPRSKTYYTHLALGKVYLGYPCITHKTLAKIGVFIFLYFHFLVTFTTYQFCWKICRNITKHYAAGDKCFSYATSQRERERQIHRTLRRLRIRKRDYAIKMKQRFLIPRYRRI